MTSFRIDLPLVPSLNNAYATNWRTKKRYPTGQVLAWKAEAGWLVKVANPPKIMGPYRFVILVPADMPGDASNRVKIAEDLFVQLGVTPDDRNAVEATARRDKSVPSGRCVVCVEGAA